MHDSSAEATKWRVWRDVQEDHTGPEKQMVWVLKRPKSRISMKQPIGKEAGNGASSLVTEESGHGNTQVTRETCQWRIKHFFPR